MHLERATADKFDAIHAVLVDAFGPGRLQKEDWRRIVDYRFEGAEPAHRGWVLVDSGAIVGFLGAIFSERGAERFCNVTAWAVKASHRKASLQLLVPLTELHDHTVLNLSPNPFTLAVFRRMGFVDLEDAVHVIPPVVAERAPRGYELVTDPRDVATILSPTDLRIYRDHQPYACTHLVFAGAHDYSYVVAAKTHLRRFPASFIYYRSNPRLFRALAAPMQRALLFRHRTAVSLVDRRLTAEAPLRFCPARRLVQPRLYKPARESRRRRTEIDTLYSELVMLDPRRWTFTY